LLKCTKKIRSYFIEYLNNIGVSLGDNIDIFILFKDFKQLKAFLENNKVNNENNEEDKTLEYKGEKINILFEFSILPCILVKTKLKLLEILEKESYIEQFDGNYPMYLNIEQVKKIIKLDVLQNNLVKPTGKNVTIALIDSGINNNIDALKSAKIIDRINITNELEKDLCGHGTMMASLLAMEMNEVIDFGNVVQNQLKGIAPNVRFIDVKVADKTGKISISDVLFALEILKEKQFDILQFSISTLIPTDGYDILSRFCKWFYDKGIFCVAPAGNSGPESYTIGAPGSSKYVFCVGASDKNDQMAFFSSRGPTIDGKLKPDFIMPGSKIISICPNATINSKKRVESQIVEISGTSASAMIFTGVLALLLELFPNITFNSLKKTLIHASKSIHYSRHSQGLGLVDIGKLFEKLHILINKPITLDKLNNSSIKIALFFSSIVLVLLILSKFLFFL